MENIIYLHGRDYEEDKVQIENSIKEDPVFLFDEPQTKLYQYIDYLHEEYQLRTKILNKLKICREIVFGKNVTLVSGEGIELRKPGSMGDLLKELIPGKRFHIIIENNDRRLLANIVQQLIYIDYPLTEIDMKLRSEYKDAAKTALFMKHIQTLQAAARSAVDKLSLLSIDTDADAETQEKLRRNRDQALAAYEKICEQIDKAVDVEMKVAVAASKKTGKSTIVNSMLGVELAPTSLELATPNTCIYKRSPDAKYHLQMVDKNDKPAPAEDFDTAEQLHERISREFKKAQEQPETGYSIDDMQIYYVSNGNNFESYTVYDTPGPDLAGSKHMQNANKAVNACDVAIFAIDYAKFLTENEVDFLRKIKNIFQEKHKFHTLIFVINKIDEALNDKGTKSRVKSIDFIRSRLGEIDEQYSDCIVFATSAQDYFYSVELENVANQHETLSGLKDQTVNLYEKLRPLKDSLETDDEEDENLIELLSNLDAEVGRIKSQLGYPVVDMKTLRLYSGIPQLMDYVSYIARSKARDEIVNSITHTIASQCATLQALIAQIANMEQLMGKTQQDIDKISVILDEYLQDVQRILSEDLTEKDQGYWEPQGALDSLIGKYRPTYPIKLSDLLRETRKDITHLQEGEMQQRIWTLFSNLYRNRVKELKGKIVSQNELDITENDVQQAIDSYLTQFTSPIMEGHTIFIKKLSCDLQNVASGRLKQIELCSNGCRDRLKKNDCNLQLPESPVFEVVIPEPALNDRSKMNKKLNMDMHPAEFYQKITGIHELFRKIFVHGNLNYNETEVKVEHSLSKSEITQMQGPFYDMLSNAGVYQEICKVLEELALCVKQAEGELLQHFNDINSNYATTIDTFKQGIDDRDYYKNKLADYARIKDMINNIQAASKNFLDAWSLVLAE